MKGFSKTRVPNMWRNDASGKYYAISRTPAKPYPVLKSLKTDSESIAKLRLGDALAKIRTQKGSPLSRDTLTMGECAEAYLSGKIKKQCKPGTIKYHKQSVQMIRDNFAGSFDSKAAVTFTPYDCVTICDQMRAKYCNTRFNSARAALWSILDVAKKSKVIAENPTDEVPREKVLPKKLELPAEEKIEVLMEYMRRHRQKIRKDKTRQEPSRARPRTAPQPKSYDAFLFLTLMLESAARPGSIRLLRPEHIHLERGMVDWLPFKHSTTTDTLPMTRKMKAVFRLLLRRHPGGDVPLVPINWPHRALTNACAAVGIKPALTPHKFRHICSTRMAEINVPYALAAQWRRDRDGGKTFMKTYVHPRHESMHQVVKALETRQADADAIGNLSLQPHI